MAIDLNILRNLSQADAINYLQSQVDPSLRPRTYSSSEGEGGGYSYTEPYARLTPDFDPSYAGGVYGAYGVGPDGRVQFIKGERSGGFLSDNIDVLGPLLVGGAAALGGGLLSAASGAGAAPSWTSGFDLAMGAPGAGAGGLGGAGATGAAGGGGGGGLLSSMSLTPQGAIPSLTGAAALGEAGAALPLASATSAGAAGTAAAAGAPLLGGMNPWIAGGLQLASSLLQSSTAGRASAAQAGAAQAGIDEQRRQYEETQRLLAPYVSAGVPAVRQLQALSGALGPEAERAAIAQIEASPTLQAAVDRGETALLQRASATGGLRGGNIQAALAQFRPQMLSQEIQSRLGQFGGLATLGSNAAARQGTFGATTAGNIGNLLGTQGQAQAGGIIGETAPYASLLNIPLQLASLSASTGRPVF
jgi:hypothetical protein